MILALLAAEAATGGTLLGVAAVITAVATLVTAIAAAWVTLRRAPARDDDKLADALQQLLERRGDDDPDNAGSGDADLG